jgi:all-trans-retinol 13,14-reductase
MTDSDYLVVGSGLAGLSFAALMAARGRSVRVLEAHEHPGGFGHTFTFETGAGKRFSFNAQLHYVWNCGEGQTVHRFLSRLGLEREITFTSYDREGYDRMRLPGWSLDVCCDWDRLADRLADLFPARARACRGFLHEVRGLSEELAAVPAGPGRAARMLVSPRRYRRVFRWRSATLQDALDRFDLPREAQALVALQWPDFLLPPSQLSFFAWTMLFAGYQGGPAYPARHFEHVVDTLVRFVEAHGGEVLLGRRAVDFVVEGRAVKGVVAEEVTPDGEGTGRRERFSARHVVCNMDPRRAAEMIGLERFAPAVRRRLDYTYSPSSFVAYLAVEGLDLRDHGFGRSNLFHAEHADLNRAFYEMYRLGDYTRPSFAVTTPTLLTDVARDCTEGTQILQLLTVADWHRFQGLRIGRPAAYTRKKREVVDAMLDVLERDYVPGLRDHLCFHMTGSPTTSERYCLAPMGNAYGSSMTPSQMGAGRLDHRTSLDNFSFCNASSGYAGFAGTIWTGCRLYEVLTGEVVVG